MFRIELEGIGFACEEAGPEASASAESSPNSGPAPVSSGDPAVVFLNGIAMSIAHWRPLVPYFSDRRRCFLHDMRGQMLSDRPEGEYSLDLHASDLATLLDRRGILRAHIVGTSYGAEVALAFALAYPERCASLVLIDGVSETDPLLTATVECWRQAAATDPVTFYRAILPWNYSAIYIAANKATLARREAAVAGLPRDYFNAFVRLCDAFLRIDLTPRLGEIHCPTLVMVGGKDILKHEGFARIMAKGIAGSRLSVIPDAGHALVIEQPDTVACEVLAFLDSISDHEPKAPGSAESGQAATLKPS